MLIWVHSVAESGKSNHRLLLDGLHCAGIETRDHDWSTVASSGIVLVDQINKSVCDFVRKASIGGIHRVLVVYLPSPRSQCGSVWHLLSAGAADVLAWENIQELMPQIVARFERWKTVDKLIESPVVQENLIGSSPAWLRVLREVAEAAHFTTSSVLISGESGTGKELVARMIHTLDRRERKGSLVVLDCTTVVPELSGSEFFGHERGSFTGATGPRDGAFALANGGTLFLDEVGELPPPLQAELLRVVQEQTYKRLGSNTWQKTEFRLVAASNRELLAEKERGNFRADLYYRIASLRCELPPLRSRREDILPLTLHFVAQSRVGGRPPQISDEVREYLITRNYPGNIRELKQLVFRMVYRHVGTGPITPGDIPEDDRAVPHNVGWQTEEFDRSIRSAVAMRIPIREISRAAEDTAIRSAVAEEMGSWSRAASRLGLTDRALQLRRAAWRRKPMSGDDEAA